MEMEDEERTVVIEKKNYLKLMWGWKSSIFDLVKKDFL